MTRNIFGLLPDLTKESAVNGELTLHPPHPLARHIPLTQHPSSSVLQKPSQKFLYLNWAEDKHYLKKNASKSAGQIEEQQYRREGGGGLEWASWFELKDERDVLMSAMIPFVADNLKNMPWLLRDQDLPPK